MMDGREDEGGGQTFLAKLLQGVEERVEPRLMSLDDAVRPVRWTLQDQTARVRRQEVVVVPQVEPLGVPAGVVGRQPYRDVLPRPVRLPRLLHQIKATRPHGLPYARGSGGGVKQLAPVEVEPQLPVRHHPQEALTHGATVR